MSKVKIGDFVRVKKGVVDKDDPQIDMSDWSGKVTEINPEEEDNQLDIAWDTATIQQMPKNYVISIIKDAYRLDSYYMMEKDVEILSKPTQMDGSELAAEKVYKKYVVYVDSAEKKIMEILATEDLTITKEKLDIYQKYLLANLQKPVYLQLIAPLPWEMEFLRKKLPTKRYKAAHKKSPALTDEFRLINIVAHPQENDLFAKLNRIGDKKVFLINLSILKTYRAKDPNALLINSFSYWFELNE